MKNDTQTKPMPKPMQIQSLDQLQKLVEAPLQCQFVIDGQLVAIEVRRLTPAISERQRAILRSVQPEYVPARKDYDMLGAKYLAARDKAEDTARAVVIYYCCPIISSQKACSSDEEIHAYVNSLLTRPIQEMIAATAEIGGLKRIVEAANFTYPSASES